MSEKEKEIEIEREKKRNIKENEILSVLWFKEKLKINIRRNNYNLKN